MKLSFNWLKEHLQTNASAAEISAALVQSGLEVESMEDRGAQYANFIVVEITSAISHPQADKLKVCQVFDGQKQLQIVCGAPNARAGLKVVLAPVGTVIPANGMVIKESQIRGSASQGMLCSADELALTDEEQEGILELPLDIAVGTKFAEYAKLNDVLFDISITPNRGDCASVYGIAREVAANNQGKLIQHSCNPLLSNKSSPINILIDDNEVCWQFYGCYIEGVQSNSPTLQQVHLNSIGIKPKNSLVDISNFCMFDFGRPNHIYDADKIKGNIHVRKALAQESFIALGGAEYELDESFTVVADEEKILAVAGVIGGELSKVDENTRNIMVEMAVFAPVAVANMGRKLNIITDSRFRFERRVDNAVSKIALDRIVALILEYCGGVAHQYIHVGTLPLPHPQHIAFESSIIQKLTGVVIPDDVVNDILIRLGFSWQDGNVIIPSWRQGDVQGAADIVEEVIRVHGVQNVPSVPFVAGDVPVLQHDAVDNFRQILVGRGFSELITWSFFAAEDGENFGYHESLALQNPISVELAVMRPTIVANLLKTAARNLARGYSNMALFEIGPVYGKQFAERQNLMTSGMRTGFYNERSVHKDARAYDFFDIKADVLSLLAEHGLNEDQLQWQAAAPAYYHPGRSAEIRLGKNVLGYCGELHPSLLSKYEITQPVMAFEIYNDLLPVKRQKLARPKLDINNLQAVTRDFAFVLKGDVNSAMLKKTIMQALPKLITAVQIFDVYAGKGVEAGYKSIAVSVKLQPQTATFSENEINAACTDISNAVQQKLGGSLRS